MSTLSIVAITFFGISVFKLTTGGLFYWAAFAQLEPKNEDTWETIVGRVGCLLIAKILFYSTALSFVIAIGFALISLI